MNERGASWSRESRTHDKLVQTLTFLMTLLKNVCLLNDLLKRIPGANQGDLLRGSCDLLAEQIGHAAKDKTRALLGLLFG
jgi:hypothetical protein